MTNANGKKYHLDHDFPVIFLVCRFQREEGCFRVGKQRKYLFDILNCSAKITLLFSPKLFHSFFRLK